MDWNAIEAISSAIGAFGVIVTVAYLAYQIRQNTYSVQGSTEQSLMSLEKDIYTLVADNASVYRRGSEDLSELNPDEKIQFTNIVAAEMSLFYSAYVQYQRKIISIEVWKAFERASLLQIKAPGYWVAWGLIKHGYPTGFSQLIQKLEGGSGDVS